MENAHKEDGQNVEAGAPPIIPATGEREAELRAVLHGVVTMFCASASSYLNGYSRDEAVDELLSALTALLDRREGELAALRTLMAKKDEALDWIKRMPTGQLASPEQCSAVVLAMDALALTPAAIADELAALQSTIESCENEVAKVYCELTNSRFSKMNTRAEVILDCVRERQDAAMGGYDAPALEIQSRDRQIADLKAKICDMGTVQVELRAQLTAAQSALSDWKQWLRLVLAVNAPTDISDDDLRKNIVAAWDKQTLALREAEAARGEDKERLLNVARGCHDYGGGYREPREAEIFHHGIQTVINALEAFSKNPNDTQTLALERAARAQEARP